MLIGRRLALPWVRNGSAEVYYEDTGGGGEPIVWIPGTGLLGSTWHANQVARFRSSYHGVTLDLRGSGQTEGGEDECTVPAMATDVACVIDALQIGPAHVIGLSLGSAVVQELALTRPELVRSAVLFGTWSSTVRQHHIRRHFESRLYALEHGPPEVYAKFAFWMSAPSLVDQEPKLQASVEEQLAAHLSPRPKGTALQFRANLGHETRDRLHIINCPALVLFGDEDLITLPSYNERVADHIPGATVNRIPRAGHLAWLERPDHVQYSISDFLTTAPTRIN